MLRKFCALGLLGATLAFTGCQSVPPDSPSTTIENANLLQLRQHTWILSHIGSLQVVTDQLTTNVPSLQFSNDGRVSGADGCNRLMGSYTAGRDTLNLSQLASTRMACPANKDLASQKFNENLAKVTHYQVYGKTLKLLDRQGNAVLQFTSPVQPR